MLRPTFRPLHALALGASALLWFPASTASAGGFTIPDHGARALGRGGAYTVGSDDLTALYYNPASLAKQSGTRVMLTHNTIFHNTVFTRAPLSEDAWGDLGGTTFDPVSGQNNIFALGAFFAVASDFGLEDWDFALGVYGPNSVGARRFADEDDPDANYGPQAFMLQSLDVIVLFYSASVAKKFRNKKGEDKFGIGATLQYADMASMKYSLVVDSTARVGSDVGTFTPLPDNTSTQLVTSLEMKDHTSFTALLGAWYRPLAQLELGASARVVPVMFRPKGTVSTDKPTLLSDDVTVEMAKINDPDDLTNRGPGITLPAYVRAGARYIFEKAGEEIGDIEVDFVWEDWSVIGSYDMTFTGKINGLELFPVSMAKNWKDTYAVRLGGDFSPIPDFITLRAGALYETAAVPDAYAHLDFPSFRRVGLSAGLSAGIPGFQVSAGYMHLFQKTVEVSEAEAKTFQQRPLRPCPEFCEDLPGVPANAGTFVTSYDTLGLSLEFNINELKRFSKQRKRKSTGETIPVE